MIIALTDSFNFNVGHHFGDLTNERDGTGPQNV